VLAEDDFGHEMRVGSILINVIRPSVHYASARFLPPQHGGTYTDRVSGKTRQFDYRCHISKGYNQHQNIFLAVECKNLNPNLPLVVLGRPRTKEESYHMYIANGGGEIPPLRKVDGPSSFYRPYCFVGKSLLRLKKKDKNICGDGDSEIYDRWSQATASCCDLVENAFNSDTTTAFVMPLVVVPDNSLWTVSYNDKGSPNGDPTQVEQCEFYVGQRLLSSPSIVLSHIHFVTLKGLSEMLSDFANADSYKWDNIFSINSSDSNPT